MGEIRQDVRDLHLYQFPNDEFVLKAFVTGFHVNWGRRRIAYNTELSTFFLAPERFIAETFGFEREILLAVSDYPSLQPRLMQAIDRILGEDPAQGRVDQSVFFLFSNDRNGEQWIADYLRENPQSRIPVLFNEDDLRSSYHDPWKIRNSIAKTLHVRDLFDYQLPIKNDLYFFGRKEFVTDFFDAIRDSKNRGLFGLRKTGKTSILERIRRLSEKEGNFKVLYYDCKLAYLREQRYGPFLLRIIDDMITICRGKLKVRRNADEHPSELFLRAVGSLPRRNPLCIIFDEIEFISWLTERDPHWKEDFLPFWQTLWAAQSEHRKIAYTIAGVNPTVVEQDLIRGTQNPMFGIFKASYVKGLALEDMRQMINMFGKRMGMKVSQDAMKYIYARYGGHPLLTRMACSFHHGQLARHRTERPVTVDEASLRADEQQRNTELAFYCRHIVSELREFYGIEYEMLELLAEGSVVEFMELAADLDLTRHLVEYGLVDAPRPGARPAFAIPVVGRYIAGEKARRARRTRWRALVEEKGRGDWLRRRVDEITRRVRDFDYLIARNGLPELYGRHSFPEAERFTGIEVADTEEKVTAFLNTVHRCFVEPIDNFGAKGGQKDYFWTAIRSTFPDLFEALLRIRVYRNHRVHRELKAKVEEEYRRFLETDFDNQEPWDTPDGLFLLQQTILDELLVGIHCEASRYS